MSAVTASEFLSAFRKALESHTFVKLTLSEPAGAQAGLRNVRARPVRLREGLRVGVTRCFATGEESRNHPPSEAALLLAEAFEKEWARAHLFTTAGDFQFRRESSGRVRVRASRPVFTVLPELAHDRRKPLRESLASEPFLCRLGVTDARGRARPGMADKLVQVVRFVEILGHLLEQAPLPQKRLVRVADMGAGRGVLTFALAHTLVARGIPAEVVGVEARPALVDEANLAASELGFGSLRFVSGTIEAWNPGAGLDVLVALHACNTATDDALFRGIDAGASLLLASPCCHQELRPQFCLPPALAPVGAHGILLERQAEILTDALRAQLLELRGYSARVFEFVEPEHSGKNLLLVGVKRARGGRPPESLRAEFEALWKTFGVRSQRLAQLLGEVPV